MTTPYRVYRATAVDGQTCLVCVKPRTRLRRVIHLATQKLGCQISRLDHKPPSSWRRVW